MYLKSLTVSSGSEIIRHIAFRNGINLIVDETHAVSGKETGNSVGKTTVLALIDFCLGASAKNIYTDPENRKDEYKLVKDFLTENSVLITLVLKENLAVEASPELRIERNFLPRNKMIRRINGESLTEKEFEENLTNFFFPGHYGKKPSFRQIISHSIRYQDLSISNTLRTLDRFTTDEEYEALYLFLLGCDFAQGDEKQELVTKIRVEQIFKGRLEKENTKSAYEAALSILEMEIVQLDRRKSNLNLNEEFESDLEKLNDVRYEMNSVGSQLGKLQIRKQLVQEARENLSQKRSDIDLVQIRAIYEEAKVNVEGIQKTFDELLEFHNRMIEEKVRYISKDLPRVDSEIESKTLKLNQLRESELLLASVIAASDSFGELEQLISSLNEKYRKKGEYENIIDQISRTEENLKEFSAQLYAIDENLFSTAFEEKLKAQIRKFNEHFASISQSLYGEQYALKVDQQTRNGKRIYKFNAFNTNMSSGKKQGEISCFDIAYIFFADQEGISCLHFLLNDKKELMHDNQLVKIAELANRTGIQFVASILRDKLPQELNREEYIVVKLSSDDKLFRVENHDSM